jgi:hypothetical protein
VDLDPAAIAVAGDRSKRSAGLAQPTRDRPRHRELMLVGGAALLYLWLLIRALGIEVTVFTMPDPTAAGPDGRATARRSASGHGGGPGVGGRPVGR